ncbi:MAG: hypothetical protein KJP23_05860, partial [Deltaproteobacteria bacterium]|nr:hypothetical protein [Deltaproteobacteria bacterium]
MFPILTATAGCIFYYWHKDLKRFLRLESQHMEINADLRKIAQRKILDLPFVSAVISFFTWFIAAITMSTHSLISAFGPKESLTVELIGALRVFVGCIIGGIVVAAIIFFITEAQYRRIWPFFFPRGGMAKMPGVFRFKLRMRMLVIFILASILPLILL